MRIKWIYNLRSKLIERRDNEPLPIKLHKRRIYILPTRFGFFLALILMVMLLGSLNYNNNMALMLTFVMMSVALVSMLYTQRNLLDLVVREVRCEPVFAGEHAVFEIHAQCKNAVGHQSILVETEDGTSGCDIPADADSRFKIWAKSKRRGHLPHPRMNIWSEFPLGLFHSWAYSQPDVSCLIYPRPEDDPPPLPSWHADEGQGGTSYGDDEFAGIRDYNAGDPLRMIAWKASAGANKLMTRIQQNAVQEKTRLDWQQTAGLDLESRISRLTAWVIAASGRDMRFSLELPGVQIPRGCGDSHRRNCLEALALWQEKP